MVASTSTTGSCSGKALLPASAEPPQAAAQHAELRRLVASSRQRLARAVNAELTRLYWAVGRRLRRAKASKRPRGCFMWRQQRLRRGCWFKSVATAGLGQG